MAQAAVRLAWRPYVPRTRGRTDPDFLRLRRRPAADQRRDPGLSLGVPHARGTNGSRIRRSIQLKPRRRSGPRLLLYSHDGQSLGHLRRNLNIAGAVLERRPAAAVLLLAGVPGVPGDGVR